MRRVDHLRGGIRGQIFLTCVQRLSVKSFFDRGSCGLCVNLPHVVEQIHQVRLPFENCGRKPDNLPGHAFDCLLAATFKAGSICQVKLTGQYIFGVLQPGQSAARIPPSLTRKAVCVSALELADTARHNLFRQLQAPSSQFRRRP